MMNGIAGSATARTGSKPIGRAAIAGILASQIAALVGWSDLPYCTFFSHGLLADAVAASPSPACPDFSAFIEAFAESAAIQRRYTRIPLVYGHLDAELLGTAREDTAFSTRSIASFRAIPIFDITDGGRIFASKKKRIRKGFAIKVSVDGEYSEEAITAAVVLPDTGFRLQYRFVKSNTCWILVEIDDRSD
jgi:hypothetical protein